MFKTKSFLLAASMVLAMAFTSVSAEVSNTDIPLNTNQKTSVYLHPVWLIAGFASYVADGFNWPFGLNLTGEFPFNERYALIVDPSLLTWDYDDDDGGEVFAIGSGIGIRRFVNANADGFYLQLMPSIYYWKFDDKIDYASALNVDVLGYIGYSIKYSKINLFFDFGMGYGFTHYLSRSIGVKDIFKDDSDIRIFRLGTKNGLSFDINIGVGIPLL